MSFDHLRRRCPWSASQTSLRVYVCVAITIGTLGFVYLVIACVHQVVQSMLELDICWDLVLFGLTHHWNTDLISKIFICFLCKRQSILSLGILSACR